MSSVTETATFDASIFVSDKLNKMLANVTIEFGSRLIEECSKLYGFSASEALDKLKLSELLTVKKEVSVKKVEKEKKEKKVKVSFPIPFNGEMVVGACHGIKLNRGLYTQCSSKPKEGVYCGTCQKQADKNSTNKPDCGCIEDRLACGLYEYKDAKGRQPTAFTAVLKKLGLNEADVRAEAECAGINIDEEHFLESEQPKKKGRPSSGKEPKAAKGEGKKGRPKKDKKVLEVNGEQNDLFAELVAQANSENSTVAEDVSDLSDNNSYHSQDSEKSERSQMSSSDKESKKAEKEAEKAKKLAEKEAEKAKKLAEKEAEKAQKLAEKEAEKEAEKAKKLAEKEAEKAEKTKTEKKEAENETEETKTEKKVEEPIKVKKMTFEGKTYLLSKGTGIVYNMEQDQIGTWDAENKKIIFSESKDEESEEEYESDEE